MKMLSKAKNTITIMQPLQAKGFSFPLLSEYILSILINKILELLISLGYSRLKTRLLRKDQHVSI
jgi:hypothetical protein